MEYICDKIIRVIEFEKLHIYFKIKVVNGILGWIFMVYDIDIHELNLDFSYLKNALATIRETSALSMFLLMFR